MLLENELAELELMIGHSEDLRTEVSAKAVGWHIDHLLKVVSWICESLKKSKPSDYQWKFNWARLYIFVRGSIPRGSGRSPKYVVPKAVISKEDICNQLEAARKNLNEILNLPGKSNFKHPYFGLINLSMSKNFLGIHTNHHLKIIRDIIDQ